LIMYNSTRSLLMKVESPSAMLKSFSNTPQPKPDSGPSPAASHGYQPGHVSLNLASEVGLMKSQNSSAKRTPNFSHPQHLTISPVDCKYHVVIVPKYRKKVIYGKLKRQVGPILRHLCQQRGVELLEGHAMADHIHMCLSVPPKFSIAQMIGFLKGKSAVRIHRQLLRERRMTGLSFWATGYCVSTVGLDEETIRRYIQEQEQLESGQGELDLK